MYRLSLKVAAPVYPMLEVHQQWVSYQNPFAQRLQLWCQGCIDELLLKARALKYKLHKTPKNGKIDEVKLFNKLMEKGKKSNAIKCLTAE